MTLELWCICIVVSKQLVCMQVAVKKLPTGQVPADACTDFTQYLQTLAFATRTCKKLCLSLGFILVNGMVGQVMPLYEESLQQLLSTCKGEYSDQVSSLSYVMLGSMHAAIWRVGTMQHSARAVDLCVSK